MGAIDIHAHLRDQGLAYKEDFVTGTTAAASGGITMVVDMPNNKPVTMSLESLRERMRLAKRRTLVNLAFYSAFPSRIEEMRWIIKEGGAFGFKCFMSQKIGGISPLDEENLLRAFREASKIKASIAVHAEDKEMMEVKLKEVKRLRVKGLPAYLKVHSSEVEEKAVEKVLKLTEETGVHVHFCHVSSAAGIKAISKAKRSGLPVTCEVTPHHLLLTSQHLKRLGFLALTNPPLRLDEDVRALWSAIYERVIDVISSDHAPHTVEEKKSGSVWDVKPGFPGFETMLPLLLTQVNAGQLTLSALVRLTSEKPSEVFGIRRRGGIIDGNYADLTIVDMKEEYEIDSSEFYSKAKYSPFDGWKVKGRPVKTFINGQLVMEEGEIVAKPGSGRIITQGKLRS